MSRHQAPIKAAGRRRAVRDEGTGRVTDDAQAETGRAPWRSSWVLLPGVVWLAALTVAFGPLADDNGWRWFLPVEWSTVGAAFATWAALVLVTRRVGGRVVLVGVFSLVALALVVAYPESWLLAGAAAVAATAYGLLGMLLTRPGKGVRSVCELLLATAVGLAGAVVVAGFDVELRPYRFRLAILTFVLAGALAVAWRLGLGVHSLGRRGVVLIAGGVLLLAASVAYSRALTVWGTPGVMEQIDDAHATFADLFGASPRPIEALIGVPALLWGVAIRNRRRQGWWMCAFGSLAVAGVATSTSDPGVGLVDNLQATGYNLVIGTVLGLLLIALDRLLTGPGGRRARRLDPGPVRPEPPRLSPLR